MARKCKQQKLLFHQCYELACVSEGHLGIEKCKARARRLIYYPSINENMKNLVGMCSAHNNDRSNSNYNNYNNNSNNNNNNNNYYYYYNNYSYYYLLKILKSKNNNVA